MSDIKTANSKVSSSSKLHKATQKHISNDTSGKQILQAKYVNMKYMTWF